MEWILREFDSRKRSLMLALLKSHNNPSLQYYCQLWNPWKAKDVQAIDPIQRTFGYKINEVCHLNFWERLQKLKNYTLSKDDVNFKIIYNYICL